MPDRQELDGRPVPVASYDYPVDETDRVTDVAVCSSAYSEHSVAGGCPTPPSR